MLLNIDNKKFLVKDNYLFLLLPKLNSSKEDKKRLKENVTRYKNTNIPFKIIEKQIRKQKKKD